AAAGLRMAIDSKPADIDELDRRIMQLQIEQMALKKEKDKSSKERLVKLTDELKELEQSSAELTSKWMQEKDELAGSQKIKEALEQARSELEIAQRQGNLAKAGELTYGTIPALEKQLEAHEQSDQSAKDNIYAQDTVTENRIAQIVERWTGIPVDKMLEGEREKLLAMEDHLRDRVVGQDKALTAISNSIRRSRAGLQDPNRPLGSFLFLGPTGVGKTELTKALAEFLFDDDTAILRIDMSEYMEKHAVARLIGAPPGYVGYEQGGVLTEAVRRRPYQVILFDEVEKAHPDTFNILLQVLDEGRLTDSHGRTIDFRNTTIVLTSNLGAYVLAESENGADDPAVKEGVMEIVRQNFRPEFLNRLDEILLFDRLKLEVMGTIVEIQLKGLSKRLADKHLSFDISPSAIEWLAKTGYDPIYGARPLKRVIQKHLADPLSMLILEGKAVEGEAVKIDTTDGGEDLILTGSATQKE
ncbi:MAG: AAA family ATPase, partial [Alphaproteobacteria bacterium]